MAVEASYFFLGVADMGGYNGQNTSHEYLLAKKQEKMFEPLMKLLTVPTGKQTNQTLRKNNMENILKRGRCLAQQVTSPDSIWECLV